MAQSQSIFSTDGEVFSGPRSPLSPLMPSQVNIPSKQIRHKASFPMRVDSSEDIPSPHESIFDAICTTNRDSENADDKLELAVDRTIPYLTVNGAHQVNDENSKQGQHQYALLEDTDFLYGRGTVLDTITEQKSCGTMRTQATGDGKLEMPNFPFVRHRDSFALHQQLPRRKQAFSHDDIELIQASYHEACAMIERETCKPLLVHEMYAEPKSPIHEPLERPSTPEGMPSWTASQNVYPARATRTYEPEVSTVKTRFRKFLGLAPKKAMVTRANRSVSDPIRGRAAPRFRPPRSVYGNIEQHPFNSAPKARVISRPIDSPKPSSIRGKNKNKIQSTLGVRFTPSATARDSEINTLRTAIERTSASAPHPIQPFQEITVLAPSVDIRCPHAKGRLAAAKQREPHMSLNHAASDPPSFAYIVHPPAMDTAINRDMSSPMPTPTSERPASALSWVPSNYSPVMESGILRTPSISSTAHLMSGGLRNPSLQTSNFSFTGPDKKHKLTNNEVQVIECWKCKLDKFGQKANTLKRRSVEIMYFVCCGHDVRDDTTSGVHLRGGGGRESLLAPRIVYLAH